MSDRGEKDFFELLDALRAWPKLPSAYILAQLGSYASHTADYPEDWKVGKAIQRELPMGRIPYSHECEKGAGFWDRITHGDWRSVPHDDGPAQERGEGDGT